MGVFITWLSIFLLAAALFTASCVAVRWRHCRAWAKRHLLHRGVYDYKEISKQYLSHVNSIQDRRSLYHMVLHVVCEIVSARDASLLLKDNGEYNIKEAIGSKPSSFQVGDIGDFLKWLGEYRRTVSRHQLVNKKEFAKTMGDGLQYCVQFHAEACVPLFADGRLLGVINIGSRKNGEPFDPATRELLDILAGQAAVAIHNTSLYEDMVRRNVKLQEVDKLKNRLLSNFSHELRTPLNSIIGLAELMEEGGDGSISKEQKKHLNMISTSSKRLLDTVSSMVDLAKLEANHLSLEVKKINLTKMVSKIVEEVKPGNGTSLKLSFSNDTPAIYGDEKWLQKLFSHVLGNAVKYTPKGEITVGAERVGEMLKVAVHDTGIGIAPDKQDMIFDGFEQADGGADRAYEGAGVGLAISRKVVELHGGRIWLTSSPGKGSHFFFTLPLKPTTVKSVELG